jgi:hypothetical protein
MVGKWPTLGSMRDNYDPFCAEIIFRISSPKAQKAGMKAGKHGIYCER